jgi:hypothetical protein
MTLLRLQSVLAVLALSAAAQSVSETPAPVRVLALKTKTAHVQGIDTDGVHLWVTSVDRDTRKGYLQEFAVADGRLERTVEVQDGARFHAGGIAADADSIWIPVAEYRASSTATIQRRNKRTMELEFQFPVADHIGCIAVTSQLVIGGTWDSRDFYVWDHQGKLIRKVAASSGNAYQDLKVRDGQLIASGLLSGNRAAVDWVDISSMKLIHRAAFGNTDRSQPLTREGMTVFENRLWLLPEDGDSRLFVFDLPRFAKDR